VTNDSGNAQELSPMDLSAEAALELEERRQGKRNDTPALSALFRFLRTPVPSAEFQGNVALSMLADVRAYAVLRDSIGAKRAKSTNMSEFRKQVEAYLVDLEAGVLHNKSEKVDEAKAFCLALNENLISRKMQDIYERRERMDSRYINYDALS
jgi:hypothetical protein